MNNQFLTLEEAMRAIDDSEDMYLDLIYKSLPKATKTELKQIGRKKLNKILDKIENKFKSRIKIGNWEATENCKKDEINEKLIEENTNKNTQEPKEK